MCNGRQGLISLVLRRPSFTLFLTVFVSAMTKGCELAVNVNQVILIEGRSKKEIRSGRGCRSCSRVQLVGQYLNGALLRQQNKLLHLRPVCT
ncbi:hypothetical protein ARMSODRAFT_375320 [Armillaria solidipes]|uniref:Secreted protein n=1 Tax=Armillaria solidipes TaxID=1076256 RepID=A0A2H3B4S0_9AGAR|nr:hypothetical protein ARMSODRAFT_375320 [Armillaria solidipes]